MFNYLLIIMATILLAVDFVIQKLYQQRAGSGVRAGLTFNAFQGLFTAVIFLAVNKFKFEFTPYSVVMAGAMGTLAFTYNIIGFKILKQGEVAFYTLFLLTGGMTVPYIWGLLFLNDTFSWLRTIGLVLIFASVVISNTGSCKPDTKMIAMCVAVFFLNGFVSVVSKFHQIETSLPIVSSAGFVILTGLAKFILCGAGLLLLKKNKREENVPLRKTIPLIIISAVLGLSYLLQLIGAKNVPATVLYPFITGGSIIFTAIAGYIAFRERPSKRLLAGIVLCFAGTLLFL